MVVGSPTTDLLESVDCLLRDCERYFPNADRNTAQYLIVQLQVMIDSVRGLLDSLDRGNAGNTARILVLQSSQITGMLLVSNSRYLRPGNSHCIQRNLLLRGKDNLFQGWPTPRLP